MLAAGRTLVTFTSIHKRETWRTSFDFFLSLIGSSVGLGNVWRFPYLCYKNGGGAFLVPYFISVFCLGMPLLFLEISLGQYMGEGLVGSFGRLVPLMQGLGIAMTCVEIYFCIYFNVIMAWALRFLFASFTTDLPWVSCGNEWNSDTCLNYATHNKLRKTNGSVHYQGNESFVNLSLTRNDSSASYTDPATEYWQNEVLHISEGVENLGALKWDLALCLLLAWILVYVCICKGIKSSGMVMYVTATSPFLLLFVLMIRAVTLPGAIQGIKFYLLPDWSKLADPQVPYGLTHTFIYPIIFPGKEYLLEPNNLIRRYGLMPVCRYCFPTALVMLSCLVSAVTTSAIITLSDAFCYCGVNTMTSFLSGIVIFPILGYMAQLNNLHISEVASSGLVFIAYPKAVAALPVAPIWSILFFLCLLMLGLDSEFVGVEALCTTFIDTWPHLLRKGYRKELFIGVTCLVLFLAGLPMVTEGGMYVFLMFDYYIGSNVLILIVIAELITVAYIYGARRFKENIEMMLGFQIGPYMVMCWTVRSPVAIICMFVLVATSMGKLTYNKTYDYPLWSAVIGWCMTGSCLVMIPLTAIIKLSMSSGSMKERLAMLIRPRLLEHQMRPSDDPQDMIPTDSHFYASARQNKTSVSFEEIPLKDYNSNL